MLTTIILAKNEAENLPRCLKSVQFCDQVVVVDSGSTDTSVKIAQEAGARVLEHPLAGDYAALRNWAVEQVKSPWVLFVDADEVVTAKLAEEIKKAIQKVEYKGFLLPRTDFMWGRELKHGDVGGVCLIRLARRGAGKWEGKVHEVWHVEGRMGRLNQPLFHYPHPTLVVFLRQINAYSTIRAHELFDCGSRANLGQIIFYPLVKFKYLYLVKLGFLDGMPGFIHAMTMAFYSFLVRGKLWLQRG